MATWTLNSYSMSNHKSLQHIWWHSSPLPPASTHCVSPLHSPSIKLVLSKNVITVSFENQTISSEETLEAYGGRFTCIGVHCPWFILDHHNSAHIVRSWLLEFASFGRLLNCIFFFWLSFASKLDTSVTWWILYGTGKSEIHALIR